MARPTTRLLVVFDFDQTIINCNIDLWIRKLLPNEKVPSEVKDRYKAEHNDWTRFMGDIFSLLHQQGVDKSQMLENIRKVSFTPGMTELFKYQEASPVIDTVIASDANTLFISHVMDTAGLGRSYREIFSNPAEFQASGLLGIRHHHQHSCEICPENLCKGTVLRQYIQRMRDVEGLVYDRVAFVGDGSNDFCPCLGLGEKDLIFPRKGYRLLQLIEQYNKSNGDTKQGGLKATVVPWENANEILQYVQKLLEK